MESMAEVRSVDEYRVRCRVCGIYVIDHFRAIHIHSEPDFGQNRHILSGMIREATDAGEEFHVGDLPVGEIISGAAVPRDPFQTMDRILLYVFRKTRSPVDWLDLHPEDRSIAYLRSDKEFSYYLDHLQRLGFIEVRGPTSFRLTLDGWRRIEEIRHLAIDSRQAFVAMSFADDLRPAWLDGFKQALEDAGYTPFRVDLAEHNDKIDDRIIAEIRRSGLLVADFTGHRPGVYFEAGLAMGLGIPVIWTCKHDQIAQAHFDTRQYNHITWENPSDLHRKLLNRIQATLPRRIKPR
jgi:nucleoside 2-deoxyribosyltransferase